MTRLPLLFALILACAPLRAAETLVWSDEFDTPGRPDPARWSFEHGFVRNREMQWYSPDNATVENGCLVIRARRERFPNPHYRPGSTDWRSARPTVEYTSACLHSRVAWRYGRIAVRARLQAEEGLWPAIWFLGADRPRTGWPACGEIDLLEYYRESILANFCWSAATAEEPFAQRWNTGRMPIAGFIARDPDWRTAWHIWEMVWTPERIDLRIDGETVNSQDPAAALNPDGTAPFRKHLFLLLNLALGGQAGGSLEHTRLPATFEIDWVRVWQTVPDAIPNPD